MEPFVEDRARAPRVVSGIRSLMYVQAILPWVIGIAAIATGAAKRAADKAKLQPPVSAGVKMLGFVGFLVGLAAFVLLLVYATKLKGRTATAWRGAVWAEVAASASALL